MAPDRPDHAECVPAVSPLAWAAALTACFMVVEFAAGQVTGSLALLADAGHMLSDTASLALALFALWVGRRPRSPRKTFGYRRFEVLAAMGNGVVLGVTAVLVALEAHERWVHPVPVAGSGVVVVGAAGLALNLGCARLLHGGAHGNVNVRAAFLHVLGDALGSVAAMLAGVIVWTTGETRADPALSVGVALLLLWGAWRLVTETMHILMEGAPEGLDLDEVARAIGEVPGVESVHDLHVWSITSGEPAVTAHVVLRAGAFHGDQVARAVCEALERRFRLSHATIQPEPPPRRIVQLGTRPRVD